MFLFLDANVIIANPLLRGPHWDSVSDAVVVDVLDLYVPRLAFEEAVTRYREAAHARERALRKTLRSWPPESREHLESALHASATFAAGYSAALAERLHQMGAEILDYPDVAHTEVASRAMRRLAPFDANGNGYRDALHWYSFLELLDTADESDPEAYLLSADKKAFGIHQQQSLLQDIESMDSEWVVRFVHDIADFPVPGHFLDEAGAMDWELDRQLEAAVTDAVKAGGSPSDFTHTLAQQARHDSADVVDVISLSVDVTQVRIERRTRDLWINFTAVAGCRVAFESMDLVDEERGDLAFVQEEKRMIFHLEGNAYSDNRGIDQVSPLRLIDAVDVRAWERS
jgi:hypothetical protein